MVDYGKVRSTVKPNPLWLMNSAFGSTPIFRKFLKMSVKKMNSWAMNSTWFSTVRTNSFCNRQRTMRRCSSRSQIHSLRYVKSMKWWDKEGVKNHGKGICWPYQKGLENPWWCAGKIESSGSGFGWRWYRLITNLIIKILFRKDVAEMAVVYATLIVKGKKTFTDVPARIQEQVKQVLIDLDCPELAE